MRASSLRRLSLRFCSAAALSVLAPLCFERSAAAWSPSCESAERYTLENGTEVVLVPEAGVPTVALVSSVHTGFRDDPPGRAGLAHYVEHLTFVGDSRLASPSDLYEQMGATDFNAATSADTTDYYAVIPPSQLERALWIEARRLALGVDVPTEERAISERRVLLREHASRYGHVPAYSLMQATYAALYPSGHPYHASFASEDSIDRLTLNDARWFFARHYRPDQTRLVVVGDFDPGAAKASIEKHFGGIAPRASVPAQGASDTGACRWEEAPRGGVPKRIVQHTRAKNERLELIWPVAPDEKPELRRAEFSTLRGELSQALRQTGLSHQVNAELVNLELGAFWDLRVEVAPGQPFDKVEPLVARVLHDTQVAVPGARDRLAKRQAFELSDQLMRERLLSRARGLAQRSCTASSCIDSSRQPAASGGEASERFALGNAMVIERRYSIGASEGGDLEVVR